jgi:hypothetical protein
MNAIQVVGIILLILFLLAFAAFAVIVSLYGQASAKNKWAKVNYWKEGNHYRARVQFADDLTGVSAIHIHRETNGTVGPIIAWLATSATWHNGALQKTVNKNSPCCDAKGCTLQAPLGVTLDVAQAAGKTVDLDIPYGALGDSCDAMNMLKKRNVYLVVHGKNIPAQDPGSLDILNHTKFK